MTFEEAVKKFLACVAEIAARKPAYRQPGDGSDGTCDCIGLIIGAIRRMGLRWTGIHGSNWAARKEVISLQRIGSARDLQLGDVVFKAYEPGNTRNRLPARYKSGGKYYTGDLKDYYHVGVVTQVNPLRITHMTSPTVRVDTSLGKWAYHGQLRILVNASGGVSPEPAPEPKDDPAPCTGSRAIVVAANGNPVRMRQYPSTSCRTWVRLPVGTAVEINAPGEQWAQISYGTRRGWYMMAEFLDVVGDGKGQY